MDRHMMHAMAVVLPSAAMSARREPCLTHVEMHMSTLGPGVTVWTRTATAYSNQVQRVMRWVLDEVRPQTWCILDVVSGEEGEKAKR
jgi:hypothetical protein